MTGAFSFVRIERDLVRAAQDGAAEAAGQLAGVLQANGEQASVTVAPDGTAQIVLEGAATIAREFGTQSVPAQPVIGTALRENRQDIGETIAGKLAAALKDASS